MMQATPDKPQFLVGKAAVTASTSDTTYGLLKGMQSATFFRRVADMTVMSKFAKTVFVDGPYMDMNDIAMNPTIAVGLAETATIATTADESSVTFSGRRLTPESVRMYIPISQHRLQFVNLEGGNINSVVMDLLMQEYANGMEEICVKSESGGSDTSGGTGYLTELDGWRALAAAGNIYDHEGANFSTTLVRKLWNSLPVMWRTRHPNKSEWRLFVASNIDMAYQDLMAQRSTTLGDTTIVDGIPRFNVLGIPVVPVPYVPLELDGVLSKTGTSGSYTWAMLVRPDNMILGYRPQVRAHTALSFEGNILHCSLWGEYAPQFRNVAEVATAVNVTPDVTIS